MIWAQSLLAFLLALATTIGLRTRHISNELIVTGLCLSAIWTWMQASGGIPAWPTGTLTGTALALPFHALERAAN
ncbi:MAG: hypothetical protein KGK17_00445 [Betaproteobacteria bacterium]|nr:hypothetical protein [Betaproteobacteria bacterium]